jgi:hypothetical protein
MQCAFVETDGKCRIHSLIVGANSLILSAFMRARARLASRKHSQGSENDFVGFAGVTQAVCNIGCVVGRWWQAAMQRATHCLAISDCPDMLLHQDLACVGLLIQGCKIGVAVYIGGCGRQPMNRVHGAFLASGSIPEIFSVFPKTAGGSTSYNKSSATAAVEDLHWLLAHSHHRISDRHTLSHWRIALPLRRRPGTRKSSHRYTLRISSPSYNSPEDRRERTGELLL